MEHIHKEAKLRLALKKAVYSKKKFIQTLSLTERYEAAYDSGGPKKMRFYMNWSIANLSIISTEQDIGRPMTDEEKAAHRNNLKLS